MAASTPEFPCKVAEVDLRVSTDRKAAYADVEYVRCRSSSINNNNLHREDASLSVFRVFELDDVSPMKTEVRLQGEVEPGKPQCDLCFRRFPSFSATFNHKSRPCAEDREFIEGDDTRVVRIVFPARELPFIEDALRVLNKTVEPVESVSGSTECQFLSICHPLVFVPLLLRQLYVAHVTKFDVENWYGSVQHSSENVTAKACFVPLSDAELRLIQSLASSHLAENLGMSRRLTNAELQGREELEDKFQRVIDAHRSVTGGAFFVRLSTRSPKDAVSLTLAQKQTLSASARLKAKLQLMRVTTGEQALDLLSRSQRVFTDISMHFNCRIETNADSRQVSGSQLAAVFREFNEAMAPDHEFRCYVVDRKITAISQYHCYIKLEDENPLFVPSYADRVRRRIQAFHDGTFASMLPHGLNDYVVDIMINRTDGNPTVVELNPHGAAMSSGSALYNWRQDSDLLNGRLVGQLPLRILRELEDDEVARQS